MGSLFTVTYTRSSLQDTLFDNHVFCNSAFRAQHDRVASDALAFARQHGLTHIVELGAGTAPITETLARDPAAAGLRLTPCDLVPLQAHYEALQSRFPGQVTPAFHPVDYTQPQDWGPGTLLVLLGTFPATPPERRLEALAALTQSSERVLVWEFVRRTPWSMLLATLTFFTALLLPLCWINRPGRFRRFFWCWLVPLAPVISAIMGVAWCRRCWSAAEWREMVGRTAGSDRPALVREWFNAQRVTW